MSDNLHHQYIRILVVDDEIRLMTTLHDVLRREGYEVTSVGSGAEALVALSESPYDLLLTDLTMPQMDGIECISKLVELKPAIRILVISALADKATAVEAMEKGANGFLNKPFTDRQLNEAIADLIRE